MKTGLLSLNIHDSLTFDGSELSLHPDLFSVPAVVGGNRRSGVSVDETSVVKGGPPLSFATANATSNSLLAIGDLIEIRVWDPLPREQLLLRGQGQIGSPSFRKHPRASPNTASTTSTHSVAVEFPAPTTTPATPPSTLRPRTDSLAYSETNDSADVDIGTSTNHVDDSGTTDAGVERSSSTPAQRPLQSSAHSPNPKTTVNPAALPPVFPRPKANNPEIGAPPLSGQPPKPPTVQRKTTASSTSQGSPTGFRHTRQISEITVDTNALDSVDMSLHRDDSHDDDFTAGAGGSGSYGQGSGPGAGTADAWSKVSSTHRLRLSFVLLVTEKTLTTLKGKSRTQISMLRQVADLYSLSSYDMVTVHKIDPHDVQEVLNVVSADYVVVTIKDQFISRGDMHLFQQNLRGTWIYQGQRLTEDTRQIKAHAREIRHGNFAAKSGIVTDKTMITFRSRSTRIVWLVQLSSEMWEYSSPYQKDGGHTENVCEIYFDQWIRFLYKLFEKWKALEVTHSLTIVFFSRTFLAPTLNSPLKCRDVYGRQFEDHYKPIIENETCLNWESLVERIKEEFVKYPLEVGWNMSDRRPSHASQGNVLEAINVTLNLMQYHFMDRDLHRTGNSIVVISPGCGVFEVDKGLAGITYQRMMDNGIGSDMLSLGLPPLHIAPFFLYNNEFQNVETKGVDASEMYYEVPHWMHLSFVSYDREEHQLGDYVNPEDAAAPTAKIDGLAAFDLGAHGFLKPKRSSSPVGTKLNKKEARGSGPATSTFSALGNKAATPGRVKSHQERQLISGREFRDILEACRPRHTSSKLPSALAAMLVLQHNDNHTVTSDSAFTPDQKREAQPDDNAQPPEWGAADFGEFFLRQKSLSVRSSSPTTSPRALHPLLGDRPYDDSESGSNSSSFVSHVSSLLGISYDRLLWDQPDSPLIQRLLPQIQRSPSLEYIPTGSNIHADTDSAGADDYGSIGAYSTPKNSDAQLFDMHQVDMETETTYTKNEKHAETLRQMMDSHDADVWRPIAVIPNAQVTVVRPESLQHVESDVTISSAKQISGKTGGLDAALSQYSAFQKEGQSSSGLLTRKNSLGLGGNDSRNFTRSPMIPSIAQQRGDFLSRTPPMIMPSMTPSHFQSGSDLFNNTSNDRESIPSLPTLRPLFSEGLLTASREGLPTMSSNLLTGSQNDSGLIPNRDSGLFQNSVGSFSRVDSGRHLIRPIARSPPSSSGFLRQSTRSSPNGGRRGSQAGLGSSPPTSGIPRDRQLRRVGSNEIRSGSPPTSAVAGHRSSRKGSPTHNPGSSSRQHKHAVRRQKACNPFRQSDEDEVLAKRSHNRRRWSHVFPVGEVEFKRHSGPIWNSLTAPAILPLSVDYFPTPQELRDEGTFLFNPYTVTLGGIENKHYATHAELLLEMVRQRLAQDFQIVTQAAMEDSENRSDTQRIGRNKSSAMVSSANRREPFVPSLPPIKHDANGTIRHHLSMGHRIQVLSYDPSSDTIEIVRYNRKNAQNDPNNVHTYRFMMYSSAVKGYTKSVQTFKKYTERYNWNKVDNLVCGEEDRQLEDGMRFRSVMFGLVPSKFTDAAAEQDYVAKFKRLLDYLGKLRDRPLADTSLEVVIVMGQHTQKDIKNVLQARKATDEEMMKFTVQLRKGKRDPFEWMEIAIDSTFDTSSSYRIMFNWLVASSSKVETHVQLLHRRCAQFGLNLFTFPVSSVSRDLFLHAFVVPTLIAIPDKEKAEKLDMLLVDMDFVDDGIRLTDSQFLDCVDDCHSFDFPTYRSGRIRPIPSLQFIHRSGTLFVRHIRDRQGWSVLAGMVNYRCTSKGQDLAALAIQKLQEVRNNVKRL